MRGCAEDGEYVVLDSAKNGLFVSEVEAEEK